MNRQLKVLRSSFIRMCLRDSEGEETQQCLLPFHMKLPQCKRETKGAFHTRSHVQEQLQNLLIRFPVTILAPTNFYHCVNYIISFVKDKAKTTSIGQLLASQLQLQQEEQKALIAGGSRISSLQPGWDGRRGSAPLHSTLHVDMLLNPKEQPHHCTASPLHPPLAQSCAACPSLPGPRDQDPQVMQAALKRMVRNTSLPKTGFRELCISNRWVKRGVEKFGKTMEEASWLLAEGSTLCPGAPSVGGWFSFCPPVLTPISQSCFLPFPPGCLGTPTVFGRKMLPTASH